MFNFSAYRLNLMSRHVTDETKDGNKILKLKPSGSPESDYLFLYLFLVACSVNSSHGVEVSAFREHGVERQNRVILREESIR
jgi:hypothetical protein